MSRTCLEWARVRSGDTLSIKHKRAKVTVLNFVTFLSVLLALKQSTFTFSAQILMNHVFFLGEYATHLFSFWRWEWPEQVSVQCQSRPF